MSIREIAAHLPSHAAETIRQVLEEAEPISYTRVHERPAPVLGSFHTVIDQILTDDEHAPPKQRHTAMQVFRTPP